MKPIQEQILAAGIVPPLSNADAEKCAQDLADSIYDKKRRQAIYEAFCSTRPDLKDWEAQAIRNRALCLAKDALQPPFPYPETLAALPPKIKYTDLGRGRIVYQCPDSCWSKHLSAWNKVADENPAAPEPFPFNHTVFTA